MFVNAHGYYSLAKTGAIAEPMRIFGALLPDSALTGTIDWTGLHDQKTIGAFAKKLPQAYAQLAPGLIDHYELDLRSHDSYESGAGYAFSHQTPQLRSLVSHACGLTSPKQIKGLAHNFIEAGVDINLLKNDSTIQGTVRQALDRVNSDHIAKYMADFFKTDANTTKSRLSAYTNLITRYNLQNLEDWVALWEEIVLLLLGNKINKQATKQALLLAVELTDKDYALAIAKS